MCKLLIALFMLLKEISHTLQTSQQFAVLYNFTVRALDVRPKHI